MDPNAVKQASALMEDPSLVSLETRLQREAEEEYGSLPWVQNKPAGFKPLRVFLSYGHPEGEICRHIYKALKARGHDPWFDKTKIRSGEDWRGAIAQGVQDSQVVIACLSEYSTRDTENDRSVCLDELAIAVSTKEGNVQTLLLGPESIVPDLVSHNQWLDMSDWEEKLHAGSGVFMPWFAACMSELFRMIENPDNAVFAGQINALKEILQPACDSSRRRQVELLKKGVVGREWLAKQVNAWLDDKNGRSVCLLYGGPGVGKSAFSAYYTHYHSRVAAALFCAGGQPNFNDPCRVLRTLAYLLACRLPDYRLALLRKLTADVEAIAGTQGKDLQEAAGPVREQLAGYSPSELFDILFRNALPQTIDGGRPNMVILIDGLDECGDREGNALARVLSECFGSRNSGLWPRWLKVLVVARKAQDVTQWLPDAGDGGAVLWLPLKETGKENLADIRTYFVQHLEDLFGQEPAWPQALAALTERSGGYFLYAELMTALLRQEGSLEDINSYPKGLDNAFLLWFERTFPDIMVYRKDFQNALGALAVAPAPLPESVLQDTLDWDDTALAQFIAPLEPLLRHGKNEFGDRTIAFYHPYVGEWLTEAHKAEPPYHKYYHSRETALQKLAGRFFGMVQDETQTPADYVLLWLPVILRQAPAADRKGTRARRYKELVQNESYLEKLLAAAAKYGLADPSLTASFCETACAVAHDGADDKNDLTSQFRLADCLRTLAVDHLGLENISTAFRLQNESIDVLSSIKDSLTAWSAPVPDILSMQARMADAYDDLARMYISQLRFGMAEAASQKALAQYMDLISALYDSDLSKCCDPNRTFLMTLFSDLLETLAFLLHWRNDSDREYLVHLWESALYLRYIAALAGRDRSAWQDFLLKIVDFDAHDGYLLHWLDDGDYAWSLWSVVYPDVSDIQKMAELLFPDPAKRHLSAPARRKANLMEPLVRGESVFSAKLAAYRVKKNLQERDLALSDTPANRSTLAATLQAIADTVCDQQSYQNKTASVFERRCKGETLDAVCLPAGDADEWQYLDALDKIVFDGESVLSLYQRAYSLLCGVVSSVQENDSLREQFAALCWSFAKKLPPEDPQRTVIARAGQKSAAKLYASEKNHWHSCLQKWLTQLTQSTGRTSQSVVFSPTLVYLTTHLGLWFSADTRCLDFLCVQCGDDPFRAILMTDLLIRQGRLDSARKSIASFEDTVRLWFDTVFPDSASYQEEIRPLLQFILAAPGPIPAQELWQIVKNQYNNQFAAVGKFSETMLQLTPLLRRSREPGQALTLAFRDRRLVHWLLSGQAGAYRVDMA